MCMCDVRMCMCDVCVCVCLRVCVCVGVCVWRRDGKRHMCGELPTWVGSCPHGRGVAHMGGRCPHGRGDAHMGGVLRRVFVYATCVSEAVLVVGARACRCVKGRGRWGRLCVRCKGSVAGRERVRKRSGGEVLSMLAHMGGCDMESATQGGKMNKCSDPHGRSVGYDVRGVCIHHYRFWSAGSGRGVQVLGCSHMSVYVCMYGCMYVCICVSMNVYV
jgi:hypothetical protein